MGEKRPPPNLGDPVHLLAFGLGSGCAPVAPGTFGTLAAIPLYLLVAPLSAPIYGALVVVLFVVGVWLCGRTAKQLGVHDHPGIVWDEWVGFLLTMFLAPVSWVSVLLGFVLFRFFDIAKPWPVRIADRRVGGGFGIMLDDVLAGIYAAIVLQLIGRLWLGW